jgi:predicted CopG family antitoxin
VVNAVTTAQTAANRKKPFEIVIVCGFSLEMNFYFKQLNRDETQKSRDQTGDAQGNVKMQVKLDSLLHTCDLDPYLCTMHNARMSTKTISLKMEAYKKLKAARRYPEESFSEVILRATWPEETITAEEFLVRYRKHGPFFKENVHTKIEKLKRSDRPPVDKWKNR